MWVEPIGCNFCRVPLGQWSPGWHGHQKDRFFHGYYDTYCYLPLYVFCGRHLLASKERAPWASAGGSRAMIRATSSTLPALASRFAGRSDCPKMEPLDTEAGQRFIDRFVESIGGVDLIIFDNIDALTHWKGSKASPRRVLFIDGEMSNRQFKQRLEDAARRAGSGPATFHALCRDAAGRQWRRDQG